MKNPLIVVALIMLVFVSCTSNETSTMSTSLADISVTTTNTFDVNTDSSAINWKGEMLNLYSHEGTVKVKSGRIEIVNDTVKSGNIVVDLTTMQPTDNGYTEDETPEKLVLHLASNDFFNIMQYPTASFEITGSTGSEVTGKLTVRGITNDETVRNVTILQLNSKTIVTGDLIFDRTKYDVKFSMPIKEKVLSNDISLKIRLTN